MSYVHSSFEITFIIYFLLFVLNNVNANRVIELNEKFIDFYKSDSRQWLIKFYAPWCHHCKELEPVYNQVAQLVHNEDMNVYVGRVDCTRFTSLPTHFSVRGFPTLLFINSKKVVEYTGDRNKDDILEFIKRVSGDSIRKINNCNDLEKLSSLHDISFVSIGLNPIWSNYSDLAELHYSHNWFYQIPLNCTGYEAGIYAFKSSKSNKTVINKFENTTDLNLSQWIKMKRFPVFVKVSIGNFNLLLNSGKILAIALVEEIRHSKKLVSLKHQEFRDLIEAISYSYETNDILFGWTSDINMINIIAIRSISLPNIIFIESNTLKHYLIEEELLPQNILKVIDAINKGSIEFYGGDTFFYRIRRMLFESINNLMAMYKGNPILTLLVFGLPLSFLSVIIYTSCCSDVCIIDEEEEEEEDEVIPDGHVKNE